MYCTVHCYVTLTVQRPQSGWLIPTEILPSQPTLQCTAHNTGHCTITLTVLDNIVNTVQYNVLYTALYMVLYTVLYAILYTDVQVASRTGFSSKEKNAFCLLFILLKTVQHNEL